jgi:hypothetical protein
MPGSARLRLLAAAQLNYELDPVPRSFRTQLEPITSSAELCSCLESQGDARGPRA